MLEHAYLRRKFRELLDKNIAAVGGYESALQTSGDSGTAEELDMLLEDKRRHIELTERLLEIVE
jgi:hypothetical protein